VPKPRSKRGSLGIGIKIYKRERSPFWWVDIHTEAGRVRRSTGERNRRQAEAKARQLHAETIAEAGRTERRPEDDLATLAGLDVAEAVARGVGARQRQSIEACWGHACRILGADRKPPSIQYDLMVRYIASRRAEGARGQTIVKEIQAVKRGLRIARRRGSLESLPEEWPKVRRDPPDDKQKGKLHPADVVGRWLHAVAELSEQAWRQAEIAVRTGLRAEELRALTWDWVEPAPESTGVPAVLRIPAKAAKTRRERVVGLTAEALVVLDQAQEAVDGWDVPLLVGNYRKTFATAAKAIDYPRTITLRDLRHCHATWAAQGTGDAAAAQAALGHTDLRTTQRYLSTTITRTASAAVAVGAALTPSDTGTDERHTPASHGCVGTQEGEDPAELKAAARSILSTSRGDRIRTCDPLLPKQLREAYEHAERCEDCASRLLKLVWLCPDFNSFCHDECHDSSGEGAA